MYAETVPVWPEPLNARSPVFPVKHWGFRKWISASSKEMRALVDGRNDEFGARVRKRAKAIDFCMTWVQGRVCECGAPQPGSGKIAPMGGGPCRSRLCPRCGAARSAANSEWLQRTVDVVHAGEQRPGYAWRHITLTSEYDPFNPDDVSIEGLKRRRADLRRGFQAVWKDVLIRRVEFVQNKTNSRVRLKVKERFEGVGAWFATEIAGRGNVHAHVLYYGPFVPGELFRQVYEAALGRTGFVKIQRLDGREGLDKAIREVGKYVVKSPGPKGERWLKGVGKEVIHPALAARWELACLGARLSERFGVFRKVPKVDPNFEEAIPEKPDDSRTPCVCCDRVGQWHWEKTGIQAWVERCHAEGMLAFGGLRDETGENCKLTEVTE